MKAIVESDLTLFSCDPASVDVVQTGDACEITFDLTIDAASCLYNDITTINCEILSQSRPRSFDDGTIEGFNKAADEFSKTGISSEEKVVGKRVVDVTTCIPNSITRSIKAGASISEIRSLFPTRSIVKITPGSSLEQIPTSQRSSDLLFVSAKTDPGSAKTGTYPRDATSSLSAVKRSSARRAATPDLDESANAVITAQSTSSQKIRVRMTTSVGEELLGGCFIRMIAEKSGLEQQTHIVRPDFVSLLARSKSPTIPPEMHGSMTRAGRVVVRLKQVDKDATGISITARTVSDYHTPTRGFVHVVANAACPPGQTVTLPLQIASNSVIRAYAVRGDKTSSAFSSIVTNSHRRIDSPITASLAAYNSASGIQLIPIVSDDRLSAVTITREDLRTGIKVNVTPTPVAVAKINTLVDTTASDLARYRYSINLYTKSGDYRADAGRCDISVLKPREIVAGTVIATYAPSNNQVVNIKIDAAVKSNDVNFLISYMLASGLSVPFQADLETLKKSLQNCVKFDVIRYNMMSGEAKFVGQTDSLLVDDIEDVSVRTSFLYTCEAFISSPSQLTDVIADRANNPKGLNPAITRLGLHMTKLDIDGAANKTVVKPALSNARRFFSRSNFETGTMPASSPTDAFTDGRTGDVLSTSVSVSPILPRVTVVKSMIHKGKPHIEWQYTGNLSYIDRFEVTASVKGAKWTVASASYASHGTRFIVKDDEKHDLPRSIVYSVTPIYLGGNPGDTVSATPLVIEELRTI